MDAANPVKAIYNEVRIHTMPAIEYFHVTTDPVPFDRLDEIMDPLLERLYEAKGKANLGESGPDITRYHITDDGLYRMEIGIPVRPGTIAAGEALVKTLPPFHCAGALLWGSLAHIGDVYRTLEAKMGERSLEHSLETREWVYHFESPDSEQNLMGIYKGIRVKAQP